MWEKEMEERAGKSSGLRKESAEARREERGKKVIG
jgi:hypothetical protein